MAFPTRPLPLSTQPDGKPGIIDQRLEAARRAFEIACQEASITIRIQIVTGRMLERLEPAGGNRGGTWWG